MTEYKYRENINDKDGNTIGCKEIIVPSAIVKQIRADAIKELKPFFDEMDKCSLDWICDDLSDEIDNETNETWCESNCVNAKKYDCIKKWCEVKGAEQWQ